MDDPLTVVVVFVGVLILCVVMVRKALNAPYDGAHRVPPEPVDETDVAIEIEQPDRPANYEATAGILEYMDRGDWDGARWALQRVAYGMPDRPPREKAEFRAFMTLFAARDPLYSAAMRVVLPVVNASPGIRQTALYLPGVEPTDIVPKPARKKPRRLSA